MEGKKEGCLQIIKCIGWWAPKSSGPHQLGAPLQLRSGQRPQVCPLFPVPGIIVITDGVTSVPDVAVCETLLNQLRSGTVACSFVQVRTFLEKRRGKCGMSQSWTWLVTFLQVMISHIKLIM